MQQARAEDTLLARERWFGNLLDALPAATYTTDAAGRITYYNQAAVDLWGHSPELGKSEWCGSWKLFWPDGRPLPHNQCPMAMCLRDQQPNRGLEAIAERPDGTRVPFIPYPTPLFDSGGVLVGAVNMLVEITERKRAEDRQSLLIRELHHRVKNTLATVQAIMGSTARHCSTVEEFQHAFVGRIVSLSKTHSLLTEAALQSVSFKDLLRMELDLYEDGSDRRVRLSGPEIELSPEIVVPIGMAIHELTTNAAKFGALSVFEGWVEIKWSINVEADRSTLTVDWSEHDGPPVAPPTREGFGSKLLQHVLASQIEAQVTLAYDCEGLRARIVVPLPPQIVLPS